MTLSTTARGALLSLGLCLGGAPAIAGGPLGIDHRVDYDQAGIWSRGSQNVVLYGSFAAVVGGALWLGNEDPLGHVFWQSVDSMVVANASAAVLKLVFTRSRPEQTADPDKWFQGPGHYSFPSGEVAHVASIVTPFVLEYGERHPAVYALELLPLYTAIARVKAQAHWQTDVLASFALGTAVGWYAHSRQTPITVNLLPRGVSVGWHKSF